MKLFISLHAEKRIAKRISFDSFIDCLAEIFFGKNDGICFEVIENHKSNDFTKIKHPDNHKIRVGNEVFVFSNDMKALLTVNPCELSKLKKRRTQSFRKILKEQKK